MKRKRVDSITREGEIFRSSAIEIKPPSHVKLRKGDLPYWQSIVRARLSDSWYDSDLVKAANLAACQADIERIKHEIKKEGDTIENYRGTMVINPKHSLMETLTRRECALSRILHIHTEAVVGKSRETVKSAQKQKEMSSSVSGSNDDLLAGYKHEKNVQ